MKDCIKIPYYWSDAAIAAIVTRAAGAAHEVPLFPQHLIFFFSFLTWAPLVNFIWSLFNYVSSTIALFRFGRTSSNYRLVHMTSNENKL
jgi:hypothetical protein